MHELILIVGLHLDDHVYCTLGFMLVEKLSFPLLMQAASKDNNNLVVPSLNTFVPGFVLVNFLYGGYLSKIHQQLPYLCQ